MTVAITALTELAYQTALAKPGGLSTANNTFTANHFQINLSSGASSSPYDSTNAFVTCVR